MKIASRFAIFLSFLTSTIILILLLFFFYFKSNWIILFSDWNFLLLFFFYIISIEEFYRWVLNGRRSEMSDIVAILLFFFLIFFISRDILTSIIGAFSIYLWFGIFELKDYPVLNKILIITLTTYNIIFIAGMISSFTGAQIFVNTAYSFSFWIILGLGFLLFGRKYLVIWRFMSPEYLILFLYIIAWLVVVFINEYTNLNLIQQKALVFSEFNFRDFIFNIYLILILINWGIYFLSGPIIDLMLGMKRIQDNNLLEIVDDVKTKLGIKGRIKVGLGKYPIINAMAYGSFLDKRIAIISEDLTNLPKDEITGIIAHELSHTKGKHTLILTIITSLDLIFRMLLGIPATLYDYTFGNPQLPFFGFILLNFAIYIVLFIFVRVLEAKADLKTKRNGYGEELIKALYHLESFYATGREIGLNTMLLCDEKITEYNKTVNFIDTADYLNKSIIKPSRISLLSNLINSHPPTYFRIAAVLDNELNPYKEALLPFIFLKKSKRQKYSSIFETSRLKFKGVANDKFKEFFQINDISTYLMNLKRKEIFKFDIGKQFLFKNKIDNTYKFGKLLDIKFQDDICDKELYAVEDLFSNTSIELNASLYDKDWLPLSEYFYFKKEGVLQLINIDILSNSTKVRLTFLNHHRKKIIKDLKKTKIPLPICLLQELNNFEVFFMTKGRIRLYTCNNFEISENFRDSKFYLEEYPKEENATISILKLRELIIKPKDVSLTIRKSKQSRNDELAIINWINSKQLRTYFHLKKPVNNVEIGYIKELEFKFKDKDLQAAKVLIEEESYIIVENIFHNPVKIPFNKLELISFKYNTIVIKKKAEASIFSKIVYKILNRLKPNRIFYLR